jgi:hypothetical protein
LRIGFLFFFNFAAFFLKRELGNDLFFFGYFYFVFSERGRGKEPAGSPPGSPACASLPFPPGGWLAWSFLPSVCPSFAASVGLAGANLFTRGRAGGQIAGIAFCQTLKNSSCASCTISASSNKTDVS